ncbi:holin [Escherichia coli]|nr:holin [Escherichia coli]AHM34243.1 holin [Escherichia coli]AHM38840.1 holin [Escherichia coli]
MQDKESIAGMSWLVLLIIAGWGGLVRFLMDVKQGKAKWSWINAFAQIVVSAFTGVIGGLISIEGGLSIYMILATAGDQVNSELWWAIQNGYMTVKAAGVRVREIETVSDGYQFFGFDIENDYIAGFDRGSWGERF